jgi:hypothetical protein
MRNIVLLASLSLLILAGCGLGEIKERQQTLGLLLATNAPLSAVESALHVKFDIRKRGSPSWDTTRAIYARYPSDNYQSILRKIDRSAAVGYTTTISMLTYVFLDEQNRLIDFEVDTQ